MLAIQKVIDTLEAWADTADDLALRRTDSESVGLKNQAQNYRHLVDLLKVGIGPTRE